MGDRVALTAVCLNIVRNTKLPNNASIFSAELHAVTLATDFFRHRKDSNFIIFSDSLSSLEALSGFKLELDLVQKIINDCTHLTNSRKTIVFCWIPSHVNIPGNEKADAAANFALSLPTASVELLPCDFIASVSKYCYEEWQDIFSCFKLHAIYPVVGTARHTNTLSCHGAVIINRLQLGHCHLTHLYLMSGDDHPTCEYWGLLLIVKQLPRLARQLTKVLYRFISGKLI